MMLDFEKINLDCPKTWSLISNGNTKGVFQLESRLGQSMAKKLKPQNIEQLAALISILRPGCLEAIRDGKTVSNHYIDKKNNLESIDYFHDALEPILRSTYGEMVYQEQAMQICQKIAAFDLTEADMLRKAIGKKNPEEMAKIKTLFLNKTKEIGTVTEYESEQIFSWIEKSQRYSFNKSHAISYAMNAYLSAFAKAHFPIEFFVSYLRFAKDKIDPMREIADLVNNALENNIHIKTVDFRKFNKDFEIYDGVIYFGLTNVKGVGASVFNKLSEIIDNIGKTIQELTINELLFLVLDKISITAATSLISIGAFDYTKLSRKKLLLYIDNIKHLTNKEKNLIVSDDLSKNIEDLLVIAYTNTSKKRQHTVLSLINNIKSPPYSLEDSYEWIARTEKQMLGISITCSIVDGRNLESTNVSCHELNKSSLLPKNIILGCEINNINIVRTKQGKNPGQLMAFVKVSDGTGSCDLVVFPKEYDIIKDLLYDNNTVVLSIEQSKKKDTFFVKKAWQL